ncbi:MAG: DUF1592 domain-containing protein [Armatimonadota bacterium]
MAIRPALLTLSLVITPALVIYAAEPVGSKPAAAKKAAKPAASEPKAKKVDFARDVTAVLKKYCYSCHNSKQEIASVNLELLTSQKSLAEKRDVWEKVLHVMKASTMPPRNLPQPTKAERERLSTWLDAQLFAVNCDLKDPGRVTMRRLNRVEYDNTVRDLTGLDVKPSELFPSDDVGYGFDNIGDVLTISPLLMEKYLNAAEEIADRAIVTPESRGGKLPAELPESHRRIITTAAAPDASLDDKKKAARASLAEFGRRAYRRPLQDGELDRLVKIVELSVKDGDSFERGMQLATQAVLVSPHFLFRVELDGKDKDPAKARDLNGYELASRLSYFLWSTMPDDELFRLAESGTLTQPKVLEAQVRRMLAHEKAWALVENFGEQWLTLRTLKTASPDPKQFPTFNDQLRDAMLTETHMFFQSILKEDKSVLDFIDGNYTYLNEPLAKHYGIDFVKGDHFRKVVLTNDQRRGVLTQASILTITSNPTRTSPVKRGKWVLEQILGTPPPPPPPNVPELEEAKEGQVLKGTLRERMEQHRADPGCASCHLRMDALGFGLENFDPIGAWREKDGEDPIDASGTLPSGEEFKTPVELIQILKGEKEQFVTHLAGQLLTFGLGRGLEYYDRCAVDEMVAKAAKDNYRFSTLIMEIVKSDPFRKKRGDGN